MSGSRSYSDLFVALMPSGVEKNSRKADSDSIASSPKVAGSAPATCVAMFPILVTPYRVELRNCRNHRFQYTFT